MPSRLIDAVTAYLLRRLGAMLQARNQAGIARYCYAHARSLDPTANADSLYVEARALWEAEDHRAASLLLQRALKLAPRHAKANNLMGAIHYAAEDFAAAEASFRIAIALNPQLAAARNNLGNIFLERGDFTAAEPHYRAALNCDPDYVEAMSNLAMILNGEGRYEEAERLCRRALQLRPQFAGALNNLANNMLSQNRHAEAIDCYRAALRQQSSLPEAHINLAQALNDPEQLAGAIEHYRLVLERKPNSYIAHLRVGAGLQVTGDLEGSEFHLGAAESLRPSSSDVLTLRGNNASLLGDYWRAISLFRRALYLGAGSTTHSSHLFTRLYDPNLAPEDLLSEAREWAIIHAESRLLHCTRHSSAKTVRRLRIGYLSKDFARHSVAYFIEPVIANHNRERYEIYCYSNNPKPDDVTERIQGLAEHWREIALVSDEEAFRQIATDGIDILVDLSGHSTGNRLHLLARKPAPVQASFIGYPATTGMRAIDYRIVDAITDPPGKADATNMEKLVRLPNCFLTYLPEQGSPDILPLPAATRGYITFGSFNNPVKYNHAVVAVWAEILRAIPDSRLMLKGLAFHSQEAVDRVKNMFSVQRVATDRLELIGWHPEVKMHLELYREIDIALDPFPYNGTTTTCEALWMGVPVLTLAGNRHSARVGTSLLAAVGLGEFVSSSKEDYVACAVRLASDLSRLANLRAGLRERMRSSPLLDACSFTRNLEAAYETMWHDWVGKTAELKAISERSVTVLRTLRMPDDVRICLPDSMEVMTRYVVEEQGDWFEHESPFVRAIVGPGMNAVDIGANFGVYALALGRCVGAAGRVWAFEPTPYVAAALSRSCKENDFNQVEVVEAAVAEHSGRAQLLSRGGAESQQVVLDTDATENVGPVAVISLDDWAEATGWPSIDFAKIDAEGQEVGIVRGGQRFFTTHSPLIMAEYRNGTERNDEMVGALSSLGYRAWRLVPNLQVLVPVAQDDGLLLDAPPLNLFFCKPDRAEALASADRLVLSSTGSEQDPGADEGSALTSLFALPYASTFAAVFRRWLAVDGANTRNSETSSYRKVLECYALSRDTSLSRLKRWRALNAALDVLATLANPDATLAQNLTRARVLYDAGLAPLAESVLGQLIRRLLEGEPQIAEFFVPPSGRYEGVVPKGAISEWLLAACFEQQELINALTGYLNPAASLRRLRDIRDLGYGDPNIAHRTALIIRRFDKRTPASGLP